MMGTQLTEKRAKPRRGLALRVVLIDGMPPLHATTRDVSLGGMHLMTATTTLLPGSEFVATVEVDVPDRRVVCRVPIKIVWSDASGAGAAFGEISPEAGEVLRRLL